MHPRVRERLTDPSHNFRLADETISPDALRASFTQGWRFLIENVLQLDTSAPNTPWNLTELQSVSSSDWSFLCNSKQLRMLPGYDAWISQGFTQISYVIYHLYPGEAWARDAGLRPELFAQTHKKLTRPELMDLMEHIYLRFIVGLPSNASDAQVAEARRRYYLRAKERSFFTSPQLRRYGFRANMTPHGVDDIKHGLHARIAAQLGEAGGFGELWNAGEFRKRFPSRDFSKCKYCGRAPVDLHHLLERADYPEFIYNGDNVVPLCTQAHSAITRRQIPPEVHASLGVARDLWIANEGARYHAFDASMRALHDVLEIPRERETVSR